MTRKQTAPQKPVRKLGKRSRLVVSAFEARKDGALILHVASPDDPGEHWWNSQPIRIEPQRVHEVLAACGDALAKRRSVRT